MLLYESIIWKIATTTTQNLQTFVKACLHRVMDVIWPGKMSNDDPSRRTDQLSTDVLIKGQK